MNRKLFGLVAFFALVAVGSFFAMKRRASDIPLIRGQPLNEFLQEESKQQSLEELLTLERLPWRESPEIVTFFTPILYDRVTNIGILRLLIDGGEGGGFQQCDRGSNGNCLLSWNTAYDTPGEHTLQAQLLWSERWKSFDVAGPIYHFQSSNVCQFNPFYSEYDSQGAILYAKLSMSTADFLIEVRTLAGETIKRIAGCTSNGVVEKNWDLVDDAGNRWTGYAFDAVFRINFPDSSSGVQTQRMRFR